MGGAAVDGPTLQKEVEDAGGVPFKRDVPIAFLGRAELSSFLAELFDAEYPAAQARVGRATAAGVRPASRGHGPAGAARTRAGGEHRRLLRRPARAATALRGERGALADADEPDRAGARAAPRAAGPVRGPARAADGIGMRLRRPPARDPVALRGRRDAGDGALPAGAPRSARRPRGGRRRRRGLGSGGARSAGPLRRAGGAAGRAGPARAAVRRRTGAGARSVEQGRRVRAARGLERTLPPRRSRCCIPSSSSAARRRARCRRVWQRPAARRSCPRASSASCCCARCSRKGSRRRRRAGAATAGGSGTCGAGRSSPGAASGTRLPRAVVFHEALRQRFARRHGPARLQEGWETFGEGWGPLVRPAT